MFLFRSSHETFALTISLALTILLLLLSLLLPLRSCGGHAVIEEWGILRASDVNDDGTMDVAAADEVRVGGVAYGSYVVFEKWRNVCCALAGPFVRQNCFAHASP